MMGHWNGKKEKREIQTERAKLQIGRGLTGPMTSKWHFHILIAVSAKYKKKPLSCHGNGI